MTPYANLHIGLNPWGDGRYFINLSFTESENDVDIRPENPPVLPLTNFDRQRFLKHGNDLKAYGMELGACLFAEPKARDVFQVAYARAQTLKVPLRIQLTIHPKMPYLHDLRWELLHDPVDGKPLFVRDDLLFSRYLNSDDTRPVRPREQGKLRALVVIANPTDLSLFRFAPLDMDREVDRVNHALKDLDVSLLTSAAGPASLNAILERLREPEEGYDLLCLFCHGAFVEGEPRLWLEKADGKSAVVSGMTLAERLTELVDLPRLVALFSCESAGTGDDARKDEGALAAVGPRLARAGVPAVVAMQGRVAVETVAEFLPSFCKALRDEGQIDLAMARGRAAIQSEDDSWMPVLFMRSNTGRLWAPSGLQSADGSESTFSSWGSILDYIDNGQCTPIIGSGVTDDLFGSQREIARRWADLYRYPMAQHDRDELPRVAQFRAVTRAPVTAKNELITYLRHELLDRFRDKVPGLRRDANLWDMTSEVGKWQRQLDPGEPHNVLAQLRCPIYITTNPDRLLTEALAEEREVRKVYERAFDWTSPNPARDPLFEEGSDYWPDRENPLVYHLYGSFLPHPKTKKPDPGSLVFSQDEYFQYLIAMIRNKSSIPTPVAEALTNSALLFVGFHLNDWRFRILLQSIRERGGSAGLDQYEHVAVQIDPKEGEFQDPDMARRYLEKMGKINISRLSIYWGSVSSFLRELQARLAVRHPSYSTEAVGSAR